MFRLTMQSCLSKGGSFGGLLNAGLVFFFGFLLGVSITNGKPACGIVSGAAAVAVLAVGTLVVHLVTSRNRISRLLEAHSGITVGEAASHCVRASIEAVLKENSAKNC